MKKFFPVHSKDDLYDILRQFRTDECLKMINRQSADLMNNYHKYGLNGVMPVSFLWASKNSRGEIRQQDTYIAPWTLIDLAYHLVAASNDFRGSIFLSNEELYAAYSCVYDYLNSDNQKPQLDGGENMPTFLRFLMGPLGEQIKFQRTHWIFDNMFRDIHMLLEINDSNKFNVKEVLKEETGISSWKTVVAHLVRAYEAFKKADTLDEVISLLNWSNEADRASFEALIRKYVADYDEIRLSPLGRQILYTKPYIKTQRGEVISINSYLNLFLCEHNIYWIARDYYHKLGGQNFTNYYGELFEKYFSELLGVCLLPSEYLRIDESREKRADWRINIEHHKFLIEQKSTLMRISAKQQSTDVVAITDFIKRAIVPALIQLESTEKAFGDGQYIKIILLYEDYFKAEWLNFIMDLPECIVKNDKSYWLVTIREMEMLLYTAKTDRSLFKEVIDEKINRETLQDGRARGIIDILGEKDIHDNKYIREMKTVKEIMRSQA